VGGGEWDDANARGEGDHRGQCWKLAPSCVTSLLCPCNHSGEAGQVRDPTMVADADHYLMPQALAARAFQTMDADH